MKKKSVYIIVLLAVVVLAAVVYMIARGSQGVSDRDNVVKNESAAQAESESQTPERSYDVRLTERTEEERYIYSTEDLSMIDTDSGQKVTVGMKKEKIEEICGAPIETHPTFTVYDGLVVQYTQEETAASLVVSSGQFRDAYKSGRYRMARGVGIGTSFEDFAKAYGDAHREASQNGESKTPAGAIRYFKAEGNKVQYLGDTMTDEIAAQESENIYMQDFLFDSETRAVTTMRIVRLDFVGR